MNTSDKSWNPSGSGIDAVKTEQKSYKERAWSRRQADTGWGRAFAHLVPLYPLYYAYQRNTITPNLYLIAVGFAWGAFIGLFGPADNKQIDNLLLLSSFATTPILAKLGIDRARNYGKLKLIELDAQESKTRT